MNHVQCVMKFCLIGDMSLDCKLANRSQSFQTGATLINVMDPQRDFPQILSVFVNRWVIPHYFVTFRCWMVGLFQQLQDDTCNWVFFSGRLWAIGLEQWQWLNLRFLLLSLQIIIWSTPENYIIILNNLFALFINDFLGLPIMFQSSPERPGEHPSVLAGRSRLRGYETRPAAGVESVPRVHGGPRAAHSVLRHLTSATSTRPHLLRGHGYHRLHGRAGCAALQVDFRSLTLFNKIARYYTLYYLQHTSNPIIVINTEVML